MDFYRLLYGIFYLQHCKGVLCEVVPLPLPLHLHLSLPLVEISSHPKK